MTKAEEKEILDAIEIIRKDKIHQQNQIAHLKSIIKLQNESISILKSSNGDLKDALKHHESRGEMPRVESDDKIRDAFNSGWNSAMGDAYVPVDADEIIDEYEKWVNS